MDNVTPSKLNNSTSNKHYSNHEVVKISNNFFKNCYKWLCKWSMKFKRTWVNAYMSSKRMKR
jgi:hypothetical protein